jgi:hypothetical protein
MESTVLKQSKTGLAYIIRITSPSQSHASRCTASSCSEHVSHLACANCQASIEVTRNPARVEPD